MTVQVSVDDTTQQHSVLFTLESDAIAGEVSVVGSFNGWTAGADPLVLQDDGTLAATVVVDATQDVHFRYLAEDGVWFDDPGADEVTPDGSVLHLAQPTDSSEQGGTHTRADLSPEEQAVGSDDPKAQAEAIIADSETRVLEQAPDLDGASSQSAPRTSTQATDPL